MKKKLISSIVLAGMIAFGAQAEDFTGSLFIKDATITPGGTATLSIQLTNNVEVSGFQFDMTLPEGVSYRSWSISEERLPSGATTADQIHSQSFANQLFKGAMTLNFGDGAAFTGTSGEVATIIIEADASAVEGSFTIDLVNVSVGFPSGKDEDIAGSSFTLTVGALSYDEGYNVEVLPFAFKELVEIPITMDNLTDITNIALDVELPNTFINGELYFFDNPLGRTKFNVSDELNSDGTIHVTIDRRSSNKVNAGSGTEIVTLGLDYDGSAVSAGVYPIFIKNIEMTDVDGNTYLAAPYTTEIFVGDAPKATATDGVVAFHGNYGGDGEYALLKASLPTGVTIDLTEVSAMAEDATTLQTDNVIVTADAVAYGRTVANAWGTLCLPFAIKTDDNIQLYEMTGATSSGLIFDKVASVAANTPLIFKASGDGFSVKDNNDGSFEVGFAAAKKTVKINTNVANWVINGSYVDEVVNVSSLQAYALSGGEFHRVTNKINVKAFHAWLQNNGAPMGAAIRIEEGTDGITIVEQEDGSVKLIYDLQGRLLRNGDHQQMYIENGKKVISINK